jgi:hypothetical protein
MSNEELGIWNAMRDKIRHQKYTEVNALIRFVEQDVAFEVVPAKSVFSPGESILAEMRIKNLSNRPLHVNEPQEQKLTPDSYFYKGMNQFDYDVSINPTRSTWMRTLQTGEVLRLPTLILTTNVGPHKINYSLSVSEFQPGSSDQYAPTIKRASCEFTVQPENDQARQTDSPH